MAEIPDRESSAWKITIYRQDRLISLNLSAISTTKILNLRDN